MLVWKLTTCRDGPVERQEQKTRKKTALVRKDDRKGRQDDFSTSVPTQLLQQNVSYGIILEWN